VLRSFGTATLPDVTPDNRSALRRPEVQYEIGPGHLNGGRFDEALSHFEQALF
jgi:hypothetical protein